MEARRPLRTPRLRGTPRRRTSRSASRPSRIFSAGSALASPEPRDRAPGAMMRIDRDLAQLYNYASMLSDQDVRVSNHVAMKQSADKLHVDYRAAAAFFQPEILTIGADKVRKFIASEPKLKDYRMYLGDILRQSTSHAGRIRGEDRGAGRAHGERRGRTSATCSPTREMPYPEIRLANGEKVRLDAAAYTAVSPVAQPRRPRLGVPRVLGQAPGVPGHARLPPLNAEVQPARLRPVTCASSRAAWRPRCSRNNIPTARVRSCSPTCTATCPRSIATSSCASA